MPLNFYRLVYDRKYLIFISCIYSFREIAALEYHTTSFPIEGVLIGHGIDSSYTYNRNLSLFTGFLVIFSQRRTASGHRMSCPSPFQKFLLPTFLFSFACVFHLSLVSLFFFLNPLQFVQKML